MNPTIDKIVSLLFEDLAETEETIAIREEILQNCQERYQDLRDVGISEDDAIHAVIESLSGMEEMLSEYPRKTDEPVNVPEPPANEDAEEADEEETRAWSCDPALSPIREIRMEHMGSADVIVCASQDHLIHVECSEPELTLMTGIENGVLTIALSEQKQEKVKEEIKFSLEDGFDLSSLGKMFEKLTKRFASSINAIAAEITLSIPSSLCPALKLGTSSGSVTVEPIQLERLIIGTASGDVEMDSANTQADLRVTSASGDITVTSAKAEQMQLSSTSGDIEASDCLIQKDVRLNTTSGDISWCKQCGTLNATSISGDITLEGSAESISFRTVSGDVEITPSECASLAISGNTTSGDVGIYLPKGTQPDANCNTVSGDIYNHAGSVPGSPVTVKVSTVSGDIEVN